jgi:hypothetical protein
MMSLTLGINSVRNTSFLTIFVLLAACGYSSAATVSHEGDDWLKWDRTTRLTYLGAYVLGIQKGFQDGCNAGISAVSPHIKYADDVEATKRCWKTFPITDHDSKDFVDPITAFYRKYPQQRSVSISQILLRLYAGEDLTQIHKEL